MGKGVDQGAFALCLTAMAAGVLVVGMLVASRFGALELTRANEESK